MGLFGPKLEIKEQSIEKIEKITPEGVNIILISCNCSFMLLSHKQNL